ncbi:MAG: hemolysin III family protein [Marinicellaceae bacterium]
MSTNTSVKYYSDIEEYINISTHGLAFILAIPALILLIIKAVNYGTAWHVVSFSIYGSSMILLYLASTIYHASKAPVMRRRMKVFDHAAIYLLIAGTYTPYTLVTLNGTIGWTLFGISWGLAAIGITLKIFYTGKFTIISTLAYVVMGWLIVFAINPLKENLSDGGLDWLIAGGISYTVGALLYAIHQLKFNHAIFHVFVVMGSVCHFISVYFYVLEVN